MADASDELKAELDADGDGEITKKEMLDSFTPAPMTSIGEQDHRKISSTDAKIR